MPRARGRLVDDFTVTPWKVEGVIDYDRLVERFGVRRMTGDIRARLARAAGGSHHLIDRGIFFSHRDLDAILKTAEGGGRFFMYTGRGPSGTTHIGHLVPWILARWLQERFGATVYFQLTDDEKFFAKPGLTLEEAGGHALDNALDFAALGFDPDRTRIMIDTRDIAALYPIAARVAKKITFSSTKATFGFTGETNIGMIFYTALQSAPCFIEDAPVLIPLGVDQDPHFRLTRDVAPVLGKPKPALIHSMMMPGLGGGGGKMSSSGDDAILLSDDPRTVEKKIKKRAFSGGRTDVAEHRRLGGDPDVDVSFQYLRFLFEPDDSKLERLREEYASGRMLTGELKQILIEKANGFLEEHRARREEIRPDLGSYMFG